jgi:hypothetical protein
MQAAAGPPGPCDPAFSTPEKGRISSPAAVQIADYYLERLTKCLCIQAACFPPGCVVRPKCILDVVFRYACGDFGLPPCRIEKPLAFGATIHFVRSS